MDKYVFSPYVDRLSNRFAIYRSNLSHFSISNSLNLFSNSLSSHSFSLDTLQSHLAVEIPMISLSNICCV